MKKIATDESGWRLEKDKDNDNDNDNEKDKDKDTEIYNDYEGGR